MSKPKTPKQVFYIGKEKYTITNPHPSSNFSDLAEKSSEILKKRRENRTIIKKYLKIDDEISLMDPQVFKIVGDFIKNRKLKVYGGTAINKYIGRRDKFYKRGQLPDYDVYSDNPWADAVALADEIKDYGYDYVEAKRGIHYGTFKVYVNFWPVIDITFLEPEFYDKIPTHKKDGFQLVHPSYLIIDIYKQLSEPYKNPDRLKKVIYRQKLLEEWATPNYRVKQCKKAFDKPIDEDIRVILKKIDIFSKKNKLLYAGPIAYNIYITIGGGNHTVAVDMHNIFTTDLDKTTNELLKYLNEDSDTEDFNFKFKRELNINKDYNNESDALIWVKDTGEEVIIAQIIQLTVCVPYRYLKGRYIASIDYLKYELYFSLQTTDREHGNMISCAIRYLNVIQQKYYKKNGITEFDNSPFQRFIKECKGIYENDVKKAIKARKDEYLSYRTGSIDIRAIDDSITLHGIKNRKIRIYPLLHPSDTCIGIDEAECKYPCAWNKTYSQCFDIPIGGYDPALPEVEKEIVEQEYHVPVSSHRLKPPSPSPSPPSPPTPPPTSSILRGPSSPEI